MSNRVYPEIVASYENKNYLVYLYECYGDEGKYYYLSGEPKAQSLESVREMRKRNEKEKKEVHKNWHL